MLETISDLMRRCINKTLMWPEDFNNSWDTEVYFSFMSNHRILILFQGIVRTDRLRFPKKPPWKPANTPQKTNKTNEQTNPKQTPKQTPTQQNQITEHSGTKFDFSFPGWNKNILWSYHNPWIVQYIGGSWQSLVSICRKQKHRVFAACIQE